MMKNLKHKMAESLDTLYIYIYIEQFKEKSKLNKKVELRNKGAPPFN